MQSKTKIGITLVVAIALSAAIFVYSLGGADENVPIHESGVIERVPAADHMAGIMSNDSEFMNSVGGGFRYVSGIFNQTGESAAYISASGGQSYSVRINTPNGTVESIEKIDRFPEWVYQAYENVKAIPYVPDNEKFISKLIERTGYSREELFDPENPFNNFTSLLSSICFVPYGG